MSFPWNEINIKQPALMTISIVNKSLDVPGLKHILENALAFYESQRELDESAAYCSRLIARRKNSFRRMHGFKTLNKVNSSLCRLLIVNLKEILRNFLGILPEYSTKIGKQMELPTQENLDYILIRLIAQYKLFERISIQAKISSVYFMKLLHNYYFPEIITVIVSLLAQIWKLSTKIGNKTAFFYNELLKYRDHFPQNKSWENWDNFILPDKLEGNLTCKIERKSSTSKNITNLDLQIIDLLEFDDETTIIIKNNKTSTTKMEQPTIIRLGSIAKIDVMKTSDIGTVISRESLIPSFDINEIKTIQQVRDFLVKEEKTRKTSSDKCITKRMNNYEWKIFRKQLAQKITSNDVRNTLKLFKFTLKNKI